MQKLIFLDIRDHGSDLHVGIDMLKNYCLYKWCDYSMCGTTQGNAVFLLDVKLSVATVKEEGHVPCSP